MWQETTKLFAGALARFSAAVAGALPAALAMLSVLLLSLLAAWIVRVALARFLQRVGLDRRVRQWGLAGTPPWTGTRSPSGVLARVAYWLVVMLGVAAALDTLSASGTSALAARLLGYLPQVVTAAVVFVVGLGTASVLQRNVLINAVNMQIQSARLLSLGVKWLVLVLALALAVGLGSRDLVSRSLERRLGEQEHRDEPPGGVDHL